MVRTTRNLSLSTAAFHLVAGGCSSPFSLPTPASLDEYEGGIRRGTASISGEAFSKTKGGDVKIAAGNIIHLDPVTSYSKQLFQELRKRGLFEVSKEEDTVKVDPLMLQHRRNARANMVGRFKFSSVAAGDYFVSCYQSWSWYDGRNNYTTGRWHVARVKVAE